MTWKPDEFTATLAYIRQVIATRPAAISVPYAQTPASLYLHTIHTADERVTLSPGPHLWALARGLRCYEGKFDDGSKPLDGIRRLFDLVAAEARKAEPRATHVDDLYAAVAGWNARTGRKLKGDRILTPRHVIDVAEIGPAAVAMIVGSAIDLFAEMTAVIDRARETTVAAGHDDWEATHFFARPQLAIKLDGPMLDAYAWVDNFGAWAPPAAKP